MNHDSPRQRHLSPDEAPPPLGAHDIHCWVFSLETDAGADLLDPSERERAARFRFDRDRRRFVAGHDKIRRILGQYQGSPADALVFITGDHGRPALKDERVNFNYSRSEQWGLLAVSKAEFLGADIEAVRMRDDLPDVARVQFSAAERTALDALSGAAWTAAFFNCWTRKEAVVKAMGVGLGASLSSFDVSLRPGDRPEILRAVGESAVARDWALRAFSPLDGYQAAVATDIAAPNLHVLRENP